MNARSNTKCRQRRPTESDHRAPVRNPFELLVSVILSAQATDKSVNKATAELFKVARTPRQILDLGLRGLKRYIKTIGLYNTKAANILKTCKILLENTVDSSCDAENCRRCRGRKTASVILNTAFGSRLLPWIRIFRVANRMTAPGPY
jgi:endonuclease-3